MLKSVPFAQFTWTKPPHLTDNAFAAIQTALIHALSGQPAEEVYRLDHRSVYRVDVPGVGPVAIKEVRHLRWLQRLKLRYGKEAKAVHEFRQHAAFSQAGGRAPELLGMAEERTLFGLPRVYLFMRWVQNSRTLQAELDANGGALGAAQWDRVAELVVDSARKGLVHGGHSPENILVVGNGEWTDLCLIDFAESNMHPSFQEAGFLADVRRICRRMVASETEKQHFLAAVTRQAWPEPERAAEYFQRLLAKPEPGA